MDLNTILINLKLKNRIQPWIQTYTGKKFWIDNPLLTAICIEDIAHALSMQCRYAGHTKEFYSVAEHSIFVSQLLPDKLKLAGLLHDAAEAYIGDITRPLKQYIEGNYHYFENAITNKIFEKFDIFLTNQDRLDIKTADLMILKTEAEQLLGCPPIDNWHLELPSSSIFINDFHKWSPSIAKKTFLLSFHSLTKGV